MPREQAALALKYDRLAQAISIKKHLHAGGLAWCPLIPLRVVCHERRLSTTVRNCTRDEGGPFEVGNQVLISSHRKLLSSKAMVVSVAETPGRDSGRQG